MQLIYNQQQLNRPVSVFSTRVTSMIPIHYHLVPAVLGSQHIGDCSNSGPFSATELNYYASRTGRRKVCISILETCNIQETHQHSAQMLIGRQKRLPHISSSRIPMTILMGWVQHFQNFLGGQFDTADSFSADS